MLEFLNHPALIPTSVGFVSGIVLSTLMAAVRARLAKAAARANQRVASDKISRLESENSALQTEVATLRSTEARLMKHQGELEANTRSSEDREKEIAALFKATREALQNDLKESENALRKAIAEIPRPRPGQASPPRGAELPEPAEPSEKEEEQVADFDDDLDFVPAANLPVPAHANPSRARPPDEEPAAKAESAANAFRAALKEAD